ncbi:exonuclease SbcCD subunit D [bacterium]|nr:exonuclease SbcCD subunit D [bacterium]
MRLVHTADWHLGRIFHGVHLTDDQAILLDHFIELVRDAKPDLVLITGDIYDRSVPPPDAVRLLDETLTRLVVDLKVPVGLLAGNHDSPERLQFGWRLLKEHGLHVAGVVQSTPVGLTIQDKHGPVQVFLLPYAEPALVRDRLRAEDVREHDSAMGRMIECVARTKAGRSILAAHAFVQGGEESESERPLSIGGAGLVEAARFDGFNYVALGHLHRPQKVEGDVIQYAGSLFPYSFQEAAHVKSVNVVEIDAAGKVEVERIALSGKRRVRCIEGMLEEILKGPENGESRDDYLKVTLLDDKAVYDALGRIREIYPNVLHIERPFFAPVEQTAASRGDHRQQTDLDLFGDFFEQVMERPLNEAERETFVRVADRLRQAEREA